MPLFVTTLALVACTSSDDVRRIGRPGVHESTTAGDSAVDTSFPLDTGLAWDGDLAPYPGCTPGDPGAKLLSESIPEGPVSAGTAVVGELVSANCESEAWVVAVSEDSAAGVKLGRAQAARSRGGARRGCAAWPAGSRPRSAA
jgi:hypothetical protein